MVASSENAYSNGGSTRISSTMDSSSVSMAYQDEMCEKLIQLSFAKIVNSKTERGGARLHKNLLILHLLQKARSEQRNRLLHGLTPMDTSPSGNAFNDYQPLAEPSSTSAVVDSIVGNCNDQCMEQMQTEEQQPEDEDDDEEDDEEIEEESIGEIDETQRQQHGSIMAASSVQACCYGGLECACLSTSASPVESGFHGNYRCGIQTMNEYYSSIDVKNENENVNVSVVEQHPEKQITTSRRRHYSATARIRNSSSSSDESDDSEDCASTMDSEFNKRTLKRKMDDSSEAPLQAMAPPQDWYSSPKMACLMHSMDENGLITALQSTALTSNVSTNDPNSTMIKCDDDQQLATLAVRIYDPESDGTMPLTRSLSCPGLLELACQS